MEEEGSVSKLRSQKAREGEFGEQGKEEWGKDRGSGEEASEFVVKASAVGKVTRET